MRRHLVVAMTTCVLSMAWLIVVITPSTPTAAGTLLPARVVAIVPGPAQPTFGRPIVVNRSDHVTFRVEVRPTEQVMCTVTLKYRGKVSVVVRSGAARWLAGPPSLRAPAAGLERLAELWRPFAVLR